MIIIYDDLFPQISSASKFVALSQTEKGRNGKRKEEKNE